MNTDQLRPGGNVVPVLWAVHAAAAKVLLDSVPDGRERRVGQVIGADAQFLLVAKIIRHLQAIKQK